MSDPITTAVRLDLATTRVRTRTDWAVIEAATRGWSAPLGVLDVAALAANAAALRDRAGGRRIRVASKSLRVRSVLESVLALPGYHGVLAYTLAEAIWLARHGVHDIVVGYPSVDMAALRALVGDEVLAGQITLIVDSEDHLDAVDVVARPSRRPDIRVAIDLDASLRCPLGGHVGVRRSPLSAPRETFDFAGVIARRPGFRLVGLMGYEAQIAGLPNAPRNPLRALAVRALQAVSERELRERRAATVRAVRAIADLEFVNGGGTGSLESTARDESVTELAAGSGLFSPVLFDGYAHFRHVPAAFFALDVVRRPAPRIATLAGGGWIASGPPGADRAPTPIHPRGLRLLRSEGAGEVQTPVTGAAATTLAIGDRVWFRHAKAGELSEHLDAFVLLDRERAVGEVPTYRGEGMVFL